MTRKKYIEEAETAILNRVRFHAPILYDDEIDKKVLFSYGVDLDKPVFKFDKALNKNLVRAFALAQKEESFNLLISTESLGCLKEKHLKRLGKVVVYGKQSSPMSFLESINKLNINYVSYSNYNLVYKDKFFKVNEKTLNPNYEDFCLRQTTVVDDFFVDYSEFVLNGDNFFLKIQNKSDKEKSVNLELNIPLKKGYYYFKKLQKCVMVENLLTKEKLYLNYICRNAKFSFSNVDGLENSVYATIDLRVKLTLSANEEGFVYFNLGCSKFSFKGMKEILCFKEIARKKCCEIFNLQVKTKNPKFDLYFNKTLPKKIWINWLNWDVDEGLEQKYLTLKKLFVKGAKELDFVNFKEVGLRELGIFNGEYYKKILVVSGGEKFLRVGKTFFYNINGITQHSLKSEEPISVCFG